MTSNFRGDAAGEKEIPCIAVAWLQFHLELDETEGEKRWKNKPKGRELKQFYFIFFLWVFKNEKKYTGAVLGYGMN